MAHRLTVVATAFAVSALGFVIAVSAAPTAIDNAMFFHSDVRDDDACRGVTYDPDTQSYVWPDTITNPAVTCPDAFGWTQFTDAIRYGFWTNWAFDSYVWPEEPLPLCGEGGTGNCCDPNATVNPGYDNTDNPALHCPYYPGDHGGIATPVVLATEDVAQPGHGGLVAMIDPGRVLRDEEAELVYHNAAFLDYVFQHNLYSQEGLADRFNQATAAMTANAPYRPEGVEIRFPSDAVMFKADWIYQDYMLQQGLIQEMPDGPPNNPDAPYITMTMSSPIGDDDPNFKPGLYYLVGITGAVKALPGWHWYAFEHVGDLGRCDYIGCNDSFGYEQPAPDGFYGNFIPPHTQSDGLATPSPVFLTGQTYDSGTITASLEMLFDAMGIGTTPSANPDMPSPTDEAWRSYRLKGTQTTFTTSYGVPTLLGNSVTEGGFVNSASCMTCHAQAAVNGDGHPALANIGASRRLNLIGYNQVENGAPDPAWFFLANNTYLALQTDFVWGILHAKSLNQDAGSGSGN
jgi:hypothetical protein